MQFVKIETFAAFCFILAGAADQGTNETFFEKSFKCSTNVPRLNFYIYKDARARVQDGRLACVTA